LIQKDTRREKDDPNDAQVQIYDCMILEFLYDLYKWYNTIDHNAVINTEAC